MTARIDRVWPDPSDNLTDDELIESLSAGVRVNFVESVDGAATRDGLSGGLSGPADKRLFELLRRVCDVVLVGAGTVRAETYGPMRVSAASAEWRLEHGMPEHPVFAIVSHRLDLDPESRTFTDAPVRPIVVTWAGASGRERFEPVADVLALGEAEVDLPAALASLRDRGLTRVLCEGGPTLFASLLAADAIDELCVTVSPSLEGGDSRRITRGDTPSRDLRLARVLRSGDTLLLRYTR